MRQMPQPRRCSLPNFNNKHNRLFDMNLQLFGGGFFPPGTDPATNPLLAETPSEPVLASESVPEGTQQPQDPASAQEPTPATVQASTPSEPVNIPGFDLDSFSQKVIEGIKAGLVPTDQPPVQESLDGANDAEPSQDEAFFDEMRDLFVDNPQEFFRRLEDMQQARVDEAIKPYREAADTAKKNAEVQANVATFVEAHSDFYEYADQMVQFFEENPEFKENPKGLQLAYNYAKGLNHQTPQTLLKDEKTRELIMSDPDIREAIVNDFLKTKQEKAPPPTMGSSGAAAATVGSPSKSLSEASERLRTSLNGRGQY